MPSCRYRLPNGTTPVLVSSDDPRLVRHEAAALLSYAVAHPDVTPQDLTAMLFRTRSARKHRALAIVADRSEMVTGLQAIAEGTEHPLVIERRAPATARNIAHVFPGQGSQRPGMGRLFYDAVPTFRAEADRCADAFHAQVGVAPLDYLLNEDHPADDTALTVQPALFTQMAGLAAMWRSVGIAPDTVIGHSQGEIAAAYLAGLIDVADAVRVVGVRARVTESPDQYAMAIIAADRESCEELLAQCTGWAELSVVNSPTITGISGDSATVQTIVDALTERGTFARLIGVRYPAHTSMINGLRDRMLTDLQQQLHHSTFRDTDITCLGATLGAPILPGLPVDQYWFWNLRNIVRFDKAIAAALRRGVDKFIELAEHPTLQLALHENLDLAGDDRDRLVVGTSDRSATGLDEFTRNLARVAVADLDYPWDCLRTTNDDGAAASGLPLPDFPNTVMAATKLWLPYDEVLPQRRRPAPAPTPELPPVRLLTEQWIRLTQRSLVPPRAFGIVDPGDACAGLAVGLCATAATIGATARAITGQRPDADLDTLVILLPAAPPDDVAAACAAVVRFFGDRTWWPGINDGIRDCWLVTTGGEVVDGHDAPDLVAAAAAAGFRSIGAEYPGVRFRHLDLPTATDPAVSAILAALHTAEESELALRDGGLYAKRIAAGDGHGAAPAPAPGGGVPDHVLIIGGTGNVGLEFCDHFAARGARRITLVNRSGETAAIGHRLRQLRAATTAQICLSACDITNREAVAELARQHGDSPADMIVHAAVHYSGAELDAITAEHVDAALQPKVAGIVGVLDLFPRTDDCRILLCSSIAATVGGRGMISYAAANRMLDALAHRLRANGLDCTAVQWGLWNSFPMDGAAQARVSNTGLAPMTSTDALTAGLTRLAGNTVVAAFDVERARSVLATCGRQSLLSQLGSLEEPTEVDPQPAVTPVPGQSDLKHRLTSLLAGAIGVAGVDAIDTDVPMVAIGLDSLQALEFRRRVQAEFDHDLEVADLLGGASITDVLTRLGG